MLSIRVTKRAEPNAGARGWAFACPRRPSRPWSAFISAVRTDAAPSSPGPRPCPCRCPYQDGRSGLGTVNGEGTMLHANRPGGPVAAAKVCHRWPFVGCGEGRGCTAWSFRLAVVDEGLSVTVSPSSWHPQTYGIWLANTSGRLPTRIVSTSHLSQKERGPMHNLPRLGTPSCQQVRLSVQGIFREYQQRLRENSRLV